MISLLCSSNNDHAQKQSPQASPKFLSLPAEIHNLIASQLSYPDLLALTLTHPVFHQHSMIRTTKSSRVDWLVDRAMQRLRLPNQSRCRWSSDREFVSNPEVITILRRRRQHLECAKAFSKGHSGGACLVVEGTTCHYLSQGMESLRWEKWTSRLKFVRLAGFRTSPSNTRKSRLEILRSWQGAVLAVLVAGALWLVV